MSQWVVVVPNSYLSPIIANAGDFGVISVFLFYLGACVLDLFVNILCVRETKDRSNLQIEQSFAKNECSFIR